MFWLIFQNYGRCDIQRGSYFIDSGENTKFNEEEKETVMTDWHHLLIMKPSETFMDIQRWWRWNETNKKRKQSLQYCKTFKS
jgi:hypothetical protein